MHSFFTLPQDVIEAHIFSRLEPNELLDADETCRLFHQINLSNVGWRQRILNEFGESDHGNDCRTMWIMRHFFKKGLAHLTDINNRQIKKLAAHCFSQVHLLLQQLGEIPLKDQPSVNYIRAIMLLGGLGVEKDINEGIRLLEESANGKYSPAMMLLACIRLDGAFIEHFLQRSAFFSAPTFECTHLNKALKITINEEMIVGIEKGKNRLLEAHRCGNNEATAIYALLQWQGVSVLEIVKNNEGAINLLSNAQDSKCLFLLAEMLLHKLLQYKNSLAVEEIVKRIEEMISINKRAASLGSSQAALQLSHFYMHGHDQLPKELKEKFIDQTESLKWLKTLAKNGDGKICFELGNLYLNGETLILDKRLNAAIDVNVAIKFFEFGANYSRADTDSIAYAGQCLLQLASLYSSGLHGIAPDFKRVIQFYQRGAKIGNSQCLLELGYLYLVGHEDKNIKLEKNEEIADKYFRKILVLEDVLLMSRRLQTEAKNVADFLWKKTQGPDLYRCYIKWTFRRLKLGDGSAFGHIVAIMKDKMIEVRATVGEAAFSAFEKRLNESFRIMDGNDVGIIPLSEFVHEEICCIPYKQDDFLLMQPITPEGVEGIDLEPVGRRLQM